MRGQRPMLSRAFPERLESRLPHTISHAARGDIRVRGFTLLEILVTIAIVGMLLAIAVPAYVDYIDRARVTKAITEIRMLEREIKLYENDKSTLPTNLSDIGQGGLLDPWGTPYAYLKIAGSNNLAGARKDRFLVPLNSDFDLYSRGKDRQSTPPLTARSSWDDVVRANNGGYVGLGSDF